DEHALAIVRNIVANLNTPGPPAR
ncbi:MAG: hypothetical protein JWP86_822, partial [Phenylobacterium sp.]|nr:hypothetical protein [Phenylobacterium sp.]